MAKLKGRDVGGRGDGDWLQTPQRVIHWTPSGFNYIRYSKTKTRKLE